MSDPKERQREPGDLELETETVKDLELDAEAADDVRGGGCMPERHVTDPTK